MPPQRDDTADNYELKANHHYNTEPERASIYTKLLMLLNGKTSVIAKYL